MIFEQLKHVTIYYISSVVESVKLMVQEHYDKPEYDNTLIILNSPVNDQQFEQVFKVCQLYNNIIYYHLEHKYNQDSYNGSRYQTWDNEYIEYLKKINPNEIWSMDYNSQFNLRCEQEFGLHVKYKPVRYTALIKPVNNIYNMNKPIDCCLPGIITCAYFRQDFITSVERNNHFSMTLITQTKKLSQCIPVLNSCKYILDMPRVYEISTQNQVRIFELLCMGYTVCSKKMDINIFPGLIYEWDTIDDLIEIIKKDEYLHPTEAYKELTYTDEAYEKYVNNLINLQV